MSQSRSKKTKDDLVEAHSDPQSQSKKTKDDLIEALSDPQVIEVITANIVKGVSAAVESNFNLKITELSNSLSDLNRKYDTAIEKIKLLESNIEASFNLKITELSKSLSDLNQKYDTAIEKIKVLESTIETSFSLKITELSKSLSDLNQKYEAATEKIKELESTFSDTNTRLLDVARYQRQDDLIIIGLKEGSYAHRASGAQDAQVDTLQDQSHSSLTVSAANVSSAATEETVLKFCREKLNIDIRSSDISIAHRLRQPRSSRSSSDPLPLIVKLNNKKIRQQILSARKSLKSTAPGVYINEHLTFQDSAISKKARELMKAKRVSRTWTYNGWVMVKEDDNPSSSPIKINSMLDLNKYV